MSAFGALPLDVRRAHVDAVAASSNKCIEGVPGLGFVICRREALARDARARRRRSSSICTTNGRISRRPGNTASRRRSMSSSPSTRRLQEFAAEGGVDGRGGRYRENCRILIDGHARARLSTLLPDDLQAPIIVTFHMPSHPRFVFQRFYDRLKDRGYVIYPGKLTVADSFRIGCIGALSRNADARRAGRRSARCSTRWA